MFGKGNWSYIHNLFEQLGLASYAKHDLPFDDYAELYREAMDQALNISYGKSLSEIYFQFAEDRSYIHTPAHRLHKIDKSIEEYQLSELLFSDKGFKEINLLFNDDSKIAFNQIKPLSMRAFRVYTPLDMCLEDCPALVELDLDIFVNGSKALPKELKLIQYEEELDFKGIKGSRKEITNISEGLTLTAPEGNSVPYLFLLINTSTIEQSFDVEIQTAAFIKSIKPQNAESGDVIEIHGAGFGDALQDQQLMWGDQKLNVELWSDSLIRFKVEEDWPTQKKKITIQRGKRKSNGLSFEVRNTSSPQVLPISFWEGFTYHVDLELPFKVDSAGNFEIKHSFSFKRGEGDLPTGSIEAKGTYINDVISLSGEIMITSMNTEDRRAEAQNFSFTGLTGKFTYGIFFPYAPESETASFFYQYKIQVEENGEWVTKWEDYQKDFDPDITLEAPRPTN